MIRLRIAFFLIATIHGYSQDLQPVERSLDWLEKINALAPQQKQAKTIKPRKLMVFSLHTGFEHWVIPHTEAVVNIISEKSGIATCYNTKSILDFDPDKLREFDAVVLNNTCPERDERDIFYDIFRQDSTLTEAQRREKAAYLESSLINYVREGGGLILIHGGTTMQNNSMAFSEMTGGSFDFHPPQQPLHVELADVNHPITNPLSQSGFTHTDELYFFKNAYRTKNFHPLLYVDASKVRGIDQPIKDTIRYISWVKSFGKGRVFVCTPSHNAQTFENAAFLEFLMNGIQYALGDLNVNDTPISGN